MPNNRIALKLFSYFGAALMLFALVIGPLFFVLFKQNTLEYNKQDMEQRAMRISSTIASGLTGNGYGTYESYIRFIGDISSGDVWVIDSDYNMVVSRKGESKTSVLTYEDLPDDAEKIIMQVMTGQKVYSEGFSSVLKEATLTVGVPITVGKNILGVVLLHSPIQGIDRAINRGFLLLLVSMMAALGISFILSFWLSKRFADPIILKEAEDALRLEQNRREFLSNVSHELRTPVTVMRGSLEALVDGVVTDKDKVRQYHCEMLKEAKYLQRLVGDVLDLSKLQNTDFQMAMSEVSLRSVIEDTCRSFKHICGEKNIDLRTTMNSQNDSIVGDYGRIRQMIIIVLDNAIKFSLPDSVIDVVLTERTITIKDYGVGIEPSEIPYVFDRFQRNKSEQNKNGTGLGLSIAQQIANRHGAIITLESNPNQGTEVKISFK